MRKNCFLKRFSVSESVRFLFKAWCNKLVPFSFPDVSESLTSISGVFRDLYDELDGDDIASFSCLLTLVAFINRLREIF